MMSQGVRSKALAVSLSALAGYVDALGYLRLGGFFVSFMSGNSTRLGIGWARSLEQVGIASVLIGAFVAGVAFGSIVVDRFHFSHRVGALIVVASLLAIAAALALFDLQRGAILAMALAMGAENTVFEKDGEIGIGLTYMTGTLVKAGLGVVQAFSGGDRWGWLFQVLLWAGLVGGAGLGAFLYPRLGLHGLWLASGAAFLLAFMVARSDPKKKSSASS